MNKHYKAIHKYDFLTKELIQEEYVKNGLTDKKIAEKYGVTSKAIVWRKRKAFGIENKNKNKSNKNAQKNRKFDISLENAQKLKNEGKTFNEIAEIMGCSIVVAKRRFKDLGLCKEQEQASSYEFYDIELDESQKQLIYGSLVGDGSITNSGAYVCSHSIKQKEYFDHKRKVLYNIHSNKFQTVYHDYPTLKNPTESLHFTTGCNKLLYKMREIYYPDGKKIFPYDFLMENLRAEGLAYWYCDDGGLENYKVKIKSRRLKFATYGYHIDNSILFKQLFDGLFGVKIIVEEAKEDQPVVHIHSQSTDRIVELMEPYIIPSMHYKLGK